MYKLELELAKSMAVLAGKRIMEFYGGDFTVEMKKEGERISPLTSADTAANEIIVKGLQQKFSYPILSEESIDSLSRLSSEYVWIVDPLDGTKQFVAGQGEFTVNIALVRKGVPVMGVIYDPVKEELFYGCEGEGSFHEKEGEVKTLKVSRGSEFSNMVLVHSKSHASAQLISIKEKFSKTISIGSSLKGCLIARGDADAYVRFGPTSEWDICAMHAIVESAGGVITFIDGDEITYNRENVVNRGFIASNGPAHEKLLEFVKTLLTETKPI